MRLENTNTEKRRHYFQYEKDYCMGFVTSLRWLIYENVFMRKMKTKKENLERSMKYDHRLLLNI